MLNVMDCAKCSVTTMSIVNGISRERLSVGALVVMRHEIVSVIEWGREISILNTEPYVSIVLLWCGHTAGGRQLLLKGLR